MGPDTRPLVTIAIPVRNGSPTLETAIRSALDQTYDRVEVLVADNASDDNTEAVCRRLAAADSRVRYIRHPVNIGQNPNFAYTATNARGAYFRWLGHDDRLEPRYVEACVEALERHPTATLVTTYQRHVRPDGRTLYAEYEGPRPTSADPVDRLKVLLSILRGSSLWCDPVYSLMRHDALMATRLIRPLRFGDQLLACELVLRGPFIHVPECLSERAMPDLPRGWRAHVAYSGRPMESPLDRVTARSQRLILVGKLIGLVGRAEGIGGGRRLVAASHVVGHYALLRAGALDRFARRLTGRPLRFEL